MSRQYRTSSLLKQLMPTRASLVVATSVLASTVGCGPKNHVGGDANFVDSSWITAAHSCWPGLRGTNNADIQKHLTDHTDFGKLFPSYSGLSADTLTVSLKMPLQTAPSPDNATLANSDLPVLTRGQAALGTPAALAVAQSTHGSAPPDAFCAIQTGTPVGFN